MSLASQIQNDLKTAMKAKDADRLGTLRMLKSEIKNKEIDQGSELDDSSIQATIKSMIKKRRESADAYRQGDREELAVKEESEIDILSSYMPPELSDADIQQAIDSVLADIPEDGRQFGPVMGAVMKKLQGQADGSRVNALLKAALE